MNHHIPGVFGVLHQKHPKKCNKRKLLGDLFIKCENVINCNIGTIGVFPRNNGDYFRRTVKARNNEIQCLIDGEIYDKTGERRNAEWLLNILCKNGMDVLEELNGNYTAVIYYEKLNKILLQTDRYATRLLYYLIYDKSIYFSNDINNLLINNKVRSDINYNAIFDFINYEFILCDETFYNRICAFPHGKKLCWDGNKYEWKKYWDYPNYIPTTCKYDDKYITTNTTELLRKAVHNRLKGREKVLITLSSGLDSRIIASFANEITQNIKYLHVGDKKSKKTKWAKNISEHLSGEFNYLSLNEIDYLYLLPIASKLLRGQVSLNQTQIFYLLCSLNELAENQYVMDGQVQDVLLEPLFITNERPNKINNESIIKQIEKYYYPINIEFVKQMIKNDIIMKIVKARDDRISEHIKNKHFEDLPALMQYFYFTTRGKRYVWGATSLQFKISEIGFPGMDYDLFDWSMRLPQIYRDPDAIFYKKIICKEFPKVSEVPWDGNELPLFKSDIRKNRNKLARIIDEATRRITKGNLDLLTPKDDKNYLFRNNVRFKKAHLEIINKFEENTNEIFEIKGIKKLYKSILNGKNHFHILQRFITVVDFFNMNK